MPAIIRPNSSASPVAASPPLLDFEALRRRLGLNLSRSTIYHMTLDGRLPKPVRTSGSRSGKRFWRTSDVDAAVAKWPAEAA